MEALLVISPGAYTTVQDAGRFGYQAMGIPVTGVLDRPAAVFANLLVGNSDNAAVLEITLAGPTLEALTALDIAITGADIGITVNGKKMPGWHSIRLEKGDLVSIQKVTKGCRSYIAVTGGIDVPKVMGSASTYTAGKIGGFYGRPLEKADVLPVKPGTLLARPRFVPEDCIPDYLPDKVIRAIPGPQDDYFDEGLTILFSSQYEVTPDANRMGYRLSGPGVTIKEGMPKSIVSEPSMPGCIQIPADEQPIVLLAEQTVGGYAKIATVISSDIPKIAQSIPGDTLTFEKINIKQAHRLFKRQKDNIQQIKLKIIHSFDEIQIV